MTILVVDFSKAGKNPLNPLGVNLRRLIWESLDSAEANSEMTAVVLSGGKSANFSAGADLTEFGKIEGAVAGNSQGNASSKGDFFPLVDLVHKIENFPKPVIAAISGNALGGGLEVALSCHYRITDGSGRFALPEVHVGVIPGAGGTQRLPRLVGVAQALDMILTGKTIKATEAKNLGLVDDVVDGDSLLSSATKWADWASLMPVADRRVGMMKIKENPKTLQQIFEVATQRIPAPQVGGEGVHAALKAVMACTYPIRDGSQIELEQFMSTLTGSQGKARRHGFFAVRKAQKPLGKPPRNHPLLSKPSKDYPAAVIGAGLMGSGICMVLLQAGFTVHLFDLYKASLDKGVGFLKSTIKAYVGKGRLTPEKASSMLKNLVPTQKMEVLSNCRLVVEAVIEDMKIKKKIFSSLDKITPPGCILLSNTSTLDVDEMASAVSSSRRPFFGGWHFFSPAHVMKLVEIVVGKKTSMDTICVMQQLTKRIGKIGVVVGNCDGFVGNRLLISYGAETALLLEEGVASVASVDKAFLKFGIALGPFQMGDMAGLDVGYNIRKQRGWASADGSPAPNRPARYPEVPDVMVSKLGRLGQKNGKGWYDYDKNVGKGRKGLPSKEVDNLIRQYSEPSKAPFTDIQILERVLFPLVNEGFKCLEEDIAQQPSDIDVVYLYGYGWPVYRGGPMYWADNEVGLKHLLKRLEEFYTQFPQTEYYKPSKLLKTCVAMDVTVEKYYSMGLHRKLLSSKL